MPGGDGDDDDDDNDDDDCDQEDDNEIEEDEEPSPEEQARAWMGLQQVGGTSLYSKHSKSTQALKMVRTKVRIYC